MDTFMAMHYDPQMIQRIDERRLLTTKTKMKVLSALNSENLKMSVTDDANFEQKKDSKMKSVYYQNTIQKIIHKEKTVIKNLELLHKYLHHPILKRSMMPMDQLKKTVIELEQLHMRIKDDLTCQNCSIGDAFLNLAPYLKSYLSYCFYMEQASATIQQIQGYLNHETVNSLRELLYLPIQQVIEFEILFGELCQETYEQEDQAVLKDMHEKLHSTALQLKINCDIRENAYKILQIQRALVRGQPKIFAPRRKLLKEGCLLKVKHHGEGAQKRMFFLFNDILMCCKSASKSFDISKPASLICCSIVPLQLCIVTVVLGTSMEEGVAVFKIVCESYSYLLFSKTKGISHSWIEALQSAITKCQELHSVEQKEVLSKPLHLRRAAIVHRQSHPLLSKRPSIASEIGSSSDEEVRVQTSKRECQNTSFGRIVKCLAHLR